MTVKFAVIISNCYSELSTSDERI